MLTEKGFEIGGSYVECAAGKWPVWHAKNIDAIINGSVFSEKLTRSIDIIGNFDTMKMKASDRLKSNGTDINIVYGQLMRGTKILDSHEELDTYVCKFGAMHKGKLNRAYEELHEHESLTRLTNGKNIQIVDYACGQGFASTLLIEFLKKKGINLQISKAILIEPSVLALEKCASRFTGNAVKINKKFDDLLEEDIATSESCTKFHLFSNILDMGGEHFDPKMLATKIAKSQKGTNYFVCVSALEKGKLDDFMHCFKEHNLISSFSDQILNPSTHPKSTSWKIVCNIFKVEF